VRTSSTMGLISSSGGIGGSQKLGKTGADGRFRVSGPPPGPVTLDVIAEDYAPRRIEGLQLPENKDLEDVKITLSHGNTLDIRVLNAEGEPVPDAWVYAEPEDMDYGSEDTLFLTKALEGDSDADGRCRLTVPKPGVYRVGALDTGSAEQRVVVGSGTTRVELRLQPHPDRESPPNRSEEERTLSHRLRDLFPEKPQGGLTITGRLLVDGKPLPEGEMDVHGESSFFGPSYISYDGTFTLKDVPDGPVTLVISNRNGFVGTHTLTVTRNQTVSIELSTGRLKGQVTAGAGEPVEDAAVVVNAWIPAIGVTVSAPGGRTGPDGTFEIPGLGAGTYKVKISKEGFAPAETTVEVPAGGRSAPAEIVLKSREETR